MVRLGNVLRERDTRDCTGETVLSVYRDHGVVPKASRSDNFNKTPQDVSSYKLVLPSDVVVNKMKAWQGSVAVSRHRGIVSGDYLVSEVVRTDLVEPGYLHYALRSLPVISELRRLSTGVRPSQWRIYWDDFRNVEIVLPPIGEQRRIAAFLEAETERIEQLIATKARMADVARERLGAERDRLIWSSEERAALRVLVDPERPVMYGIVLPGPNIEEGPRCQIVEGGDVAAKFGRPLNATTPEIEEPYARARLRTNDVVLTIRGGIGDVALVPSWADGANITQDVARVAPAERVDPVWLLHMMSAPAFQRMAESYRTGATITGLNIFDVKRLPVPVQELSAQHSACNVLNELSDQCDGLARVLAAQVDLLHEHRRSLIAAAVSGEMRVT
jgi:type I restriction enzyme, S subunit